MSSQHTAARLLGILELLQARGRLSGSEMAAKLRVGGRTIRRYIGLLEDMGIPITAERGRAGGYELVAGYRLPPLMFTNEEALVLGLGLAAVDGHRMLDQPGAVQTAQAKLERAMPAGVKGQLRSAIASVAFSRLRGSSPSAGPALAALSASAHDGQGVRIRYRSRTTEPTDRGFDPYGLAFVRGHWYAAGYCHLRRGVRTFRVDRIAAVTRESRRFQPPAGFDALRHLETSIATLPRRHAIEILLLTDLESASRGLFAELGILEPRPRGVLLRSQADDLDWFARELARLKWPFEIIRPKALQRALERHAQALLGRRRTVR